MRHLVAITLVILTVLGESWAQNRGNSRYVPPDDFDGDITRAPRHNPTRRAGLRRQRPAKTPEVPTVEDDLKSYQPPEIPSRTTARRVPQRNSRRQVAPPPVPIEEPVPLYPSPASEISQSPPAKAEGRPRGTRRRRPKKRRRPQAVLSKGEDGEEKQIASVPENNKGVVSELINEDKKRTDGFHSNTQLRNAPPSFDSNQNFQPEKATWDSNIPPEQPQRNPAVPPYFRRQSSTNRLPLDDSDRNGNSGYLDPSPDIPNVDSPNEYIPKEPSSGIRNKASYVPILTPIRTPSDGTSRLPTDVYPSAQDKEPTRPQSSDRNGPYRTSSRTSGTDPNHIIRNTGARPIHNVIPQSDEIGIPMRGHSEVRLPEDEQPLLSSEYVSSNFNPSEDLPVPIEPNTSDESEELSNPTNRLPNPSEVHYDSVYPKVPENSRRIAGRRQEPAEDNVRRTQTSYSTLHRKRGTKPQDFDNDAEVDRQQASRYRPPLQRAGSRYIPDNSDESTRTNRAQPSSATIPSRERGSSRYQPSTDDTTAPVRTRDLRRNSEEFADVPSRAHSSSTSQSTSRTRESQRYAPETIEKAPRTRSRQRLANANSPSTSAQYTPPSPAYVQIDEIIRNEQRVPSHSSRGHTSLPPPSHFGTEDEPEENAPVRNTLRSRPQYEVRNTEPINSYEESDEDSHRYNNEYQQPRQPTTRGRTNQRTPATRQEPPQYKYEQPPNRQQNRPEPHYERPQRPRSRQQPQYQAPQNPRADYSQANPRQNKPSSRQQARPNSRDTEAPAPPRRSLGGNNFKCPDSYGFFADLMQCDKYYECRNGTAEMKLCDDGLAFNEASAPNFLRCDSLRDVDCKSRSELQEPQSTKDCPRRYGLFHHESDCTKFWNCVDGVATEIQCPPGLMYNDALGTCDWADMVESSCKTEDLLGFTCPEPTPHDLLDGVYTRYPHPDNCQLHFTCIKGAGGIRRPRMLSCNEGLVFDPATATCTRSEDVPGCEEFYGPRPPPKRKPAARQPVPREAEPEELIEEPTPRPRRRGSYRRARN